MLAILLPSTPTYPNEQPSQPSTKVAQAYRTSPKFVKVDGRLDDLIWKTVPGITDFIQNEPNEGQPSTKKTTVQLAYDHEALYVAFSAHDSNPHAITSQLTRRDNFSPSDWLGFSVDSYNDHRTAFTFLVNPSNVKIDYKVSNDDFNDIDYNWDAIWEVKTAIYNNGWVAEFRIPFNQLRFQSQQDAVWGFQAMRIISRINELSYWSHRPKDTTSFVSFFGHLRGMKNLKSQSGIQVLPYTKGVFDSPPIAERHPNIPQPINTFSLGLDAKVPIKNSVTFDVTINPDFGQVESDPSVFNLTAYETYFDEKRPFFIENSDLFYYKVGIGTAEMNGGMLFYSRRIGRTPHIQYQSSASVGVRQSPASNIIGAGKLSGKTKNGWSVGLLNAVTSQEEATLYSNGNSSTVVVEPLTNYFVGRAQKDLNNGQTVLGGIVTNVFREQASPLARTLATTATTGGLNFSHRWDRNTFEIDASIMGSAITGDTLAIQQAQKSSARYFQRPDADHLFYEPNNTSMNGIAGKVNFRKVRGNWRWAFGGVTRSPGFEINDIGYMQRTDFNGLFAWLGYSNYIPGNFFRYYAISTQVWRYFNYSATPIGEGLQNAFAGEFLNYWRLYLYLTFHNEALDPYLLRGGSAFLVPGHTEMLAQVDTDFRKPVHLTLRSGYKVDTEGFDFWHISPTLTFRPLGRFDFALSAYWQKGVNDLQYLYPIILPTPNHVLGRLERNTLYATFRANLTLTPNLTVQYYGMPYVSAGNYTTFHTISDPNSPDYENRLITKSTLSYDPNFNYKEYRSNCVLRWEYMPGSTLYFVWSQGITHFENDNHFDLSMDLSKLYDTQPHNIFLIKLNKWFNL